MNLAILEESFDTRYEPATDDRQRPYWQVLWKNREMPLFIEDHFVNGRKGSFVLCRLSKDQVGLRTVIHAVERFETLEAAEASARNLCLNWPKEWE